ncbi:MAG: V-type ATP synthase subunit E family protein [Oscillospiraceae bacterium]|nr:V-type ATP synthase subunit E family protein [Oscillospiraceae bacterium]
MALSSGDKLKNFAEAVTGDAKQICGQIEQQAKKELQEKTKAGKAKILAETQEYIHRETEKIKKEKSLEISKANIKARQEYFKYGDAVSSQVFLSVQKKLSAFIKSGSYTDYLLQSCKNVLEKTGADVGIFYMPDDEKTMETVKAELENGFDLAKTEFIKDETIKGGGLRFFDHAKNVLINDVFEEKTERAKELLNFIISPHFTSVK